MKTFYKLRSSRLGLLALLTVLTFFSGQKAAAQMAGGTYTVGTGKNYTTLGDAFSAAASSGSITGNIIFELADGYTSTTDISIGSRPNYLDYSITVKPASDATLIELDHDITFSSAQNIIFDGAHPVSGDRAIQLNGTIYIKFNTRNLTISNMKINMVDRYGIYGSNAGAVSSAHWHDITIKGNEFFTETPINLSSSVYAIISYPTYNGQSSWPTNFVVEGNLFHNIERTGSTGNFYCIYALSGLKAYNNYIHLTLADALVGAQGIFGSQKAFDAIHNTILIDGGNTSTAFGANGINNGTLYTVTDGNISNNIVSLQYETSASGVKSGIFAGSFTVSNNNIYIHDDGVSSGKYYSNAVSPGGQAEALAFDPTVTFSEPIFTDVANGDLSITGASLTEPDFRSSYVSVVTEDIDGTTRHSVKPSKGAFEAPNMIADIVSFSHAGQYEYAIIDKANSTVFQEVTTATNLSSVTPTITTYYGGSISPATGVTRDFSSPVTYTVTAEDGITQDVWTVTLVHKNDAPTDITLSKTDVDENTATGTVIGTFSTTDADESDAHLYTLVSGTGSTDNGSFTIDGSSLKVNTTLNFETKTSYSIRVKTDDQVAYGGTFEKAFVITVNDLSDETPSAISLDKNTVSEGAPVGTSVGVLTTTDLDADDEFTYTLVSGTGSTDNGLFGINGDKLVTSLSFDYDEGTSYSVRVRSTDTGGKFTEEAFSVSIEEVPQGAQGFSGTQVQKITADVRRYSDYFGGSVDISGNNAIVGVPYNDYDENEGSYVNSAGKVYFFEKQEDGSWLQTQKVVAPSRTGYLFFGQNVAISGSYAVVGVPNDGDEVTGNYDGAAYVYERNEAGEWVLAQKLIPSDGEDDGIEFGYAVDIAGDRLVVTALYEYEDANGENYAEDAGAAYVFERNGSGEWIEVQKIVASDRGTQAFYFGESAAISGDYIAIGAPESTSFAVDGITELEGTGAIYMFERNESGVWTEVKKLTTSDREEGDYTSYKIDMDGETLVVSNDQKTYDETMYEAGAAYVFSRSAGGTWSETQKIVSSSPFGGQSFGRSIAVSANTILISSYYAEESSDGSTVFIYSKNGEGEWIASGEIVASDMSSDDNYGEQLAIDGDFAIVGAAQNKFDLDGLNEIIAAGSAYLFSLCEEPDLPEIQASATQVCQGTEVTLSVGDAELNGAATWEWYSGSCDGTPVGTGASIQVNPTATTTYFVRGEGGCAGGGVCSFITIEVFDTCPETDILTFELADQLNDAIINHTAHTVTVEVPTESDVTALSPTITVSYGAAISPDSGAEQDFTSPVVYTVTAEDLSTQAWTVTVLRVLSSANDILAFELDEQTGDALIDNENHTVAIEVALGTDLTTLTPAITVSFGASVSPASGASVDLSSPTIFTVTSEDETAQEWTVTVTEAPNTGTDILSFVLSEQTGDAVISATDHTIVVEVAYGTSLTALTPAITISDEATIDPESGVEQDFSDQVTYTVTAENGDTQAWTVTVTAAANSENDILTFVLAEQTGEATINSTEHTVSVEVASGTDVTALVPTITLSDEATIDPASGAAQDFSSAVVYTVTAGNGDAQPWTVTVTVAPEALSSAREILSFILEEQTGDATISATAHTVTIEVSSGTDVSALTPTIVVSEAATISPASGAAQDFSSAVVYTVTAEDGSAQEWTATVTVAPTVEPLSSAKEILSFLLHEQTGPATINSVDHTVAIEVETDTDVTSLSPAITVSEKASVSPGSEVAQDFTSPVVYTVTAEDGTTQAWTATVAVKSKTATGLQNGLVNVSVFPNPATDLIAISGLSNGSTLQLLGLDGTIISQAQKMTDPTISMDLSKLTTGIYILRVSTGDAVKSFRIIKN